MRIFLTVIDSFGVGELPDAHLFGDEGSNTYVNIFNQTNLQLPLLSSLGLRNIDGINLPYNKQVIGNYGKMSEKTMAKDTIHGHYELAGIVLKKPYPVYPKGFPQQLMQQLESACGTKFLGNEVASGTEIIERLGHEHLKTGYPILYTSQDSVLQIAAHDQIWPIEKLYNICEIARAICVGDFNVARIIARPFTTVDGVFKRTEYRKDYALLPPEPTMLDKLQKAGFDVISVGKIKDVFCGSGITQSITAKNNQAGLDAIESLLEQPFNGLAFTNLVDTDMLFGHRNNVQGYADTLSEIDQRFATFLPKLKQDDIFIVTADHGCDPTTESTDHSREYVPLLVFGKNLKCAVNLGTLDGFDNVAKSILDWFGIEQFEQSFLRKLKAE